MTTTLRIKGLDSVQRILATDFEPVMQGVTLAVTHELQNAIAPYPPATIANSPSNPRGRWYERGYGPKWRTKDGAVHGDHTSETLGRRWGIERRGRIGHVLGNLASYAVDVHAKARQKPWHAAHGWTTDEDAIRRVVSSGAIQRIMAQAIMAALRRG